MRLHDRPAQPTEREILDLEPTRDHQMSLVIEAWKSLDSCRPLGYGFIGAIPITEAATWCWLNGIDGQLAAVLVTVIQYLDVQRSERIANEQQKG